jgi:hypothetical protein
VPAFFRRPARIDGLTLEVGERVLATGEATSGTVIATDRRLLVPADEGFHPIGWESVDRASWDRDGELLLVVETGPMGSGPRHHRLQVEEPGRLVDVVREQVNASMVITRYLPISGERGVRVTGRRRRTQDRLRWVVAVDDGLHLDDPEVRAKVDAAVAAVRAEVE